MPTWASVYAARVQQHRLAFLQQLWTAQQQAVPYPAQSPGYRLS